MAKIKIWVRTFDAKLCFSLDSETLYSDTTEKNPSIFCFVFLYVLNFNANFFQPCILHDKGTAFHQKREKC